MGLTLALLALLVSTSTSTPTFTLTLTSTSTMTDDTHPHNWKVVPIFTLKDPLWFRRFITHCKENKLGWLMHASVGTDPSDITQFDDLTSPAYLNADEPDKSNE